MKDTARTLNNDPRVNDERNSNILGQNKTDGIVEVGQLRDVQRQ